MRNPWDIKQVLKYSTEWSIKQVLKYSTERSIKQVQRVERDCKMCERIKAEKLHKSVRLQILLHHGMKSDSEDDQRI